MTLFLYSDTYIMIYICIDIYIHERFFLRLYMLFHLFRFMDDVMLMDIYVFGFLCMMVYSRYIPFRILLAM